MAELTRANSRSKTTSRTVTDTIVGEHTHTIVGYSLIKGIGDGEPIASERFTVGGHEWVLLFYPDGKRSSSADITGPATQPGGPEHAPLQVPAPGGVPAPGAGMLLAVPPGVAPAAAAGNEPNNDGGLALVPGNAPPLPPNHAMVLQHRHHHPAIPQMPQIPRPQRRDTTNEYAALFVALIGEGSNPQGVVNTSEGKVVRAFHRFTLVDQTGQNHDILKGRRRDDGAVKISCARQQDPNARNCHGYRKFVKRSTLEDLTKGYLVNDTIVIKYTIELVVSSGGALSRGGSSVPAKKELVKVPAPNLGENLEKLLSSGQHSDFTIVVEEDAVEGEGEPYSEEIKVHKIILEARSPVFAAMLKRDMREGSEGKVVIRDIKAPVFRALLHFVYTDSLPKDLDGDNLTVAMAQHLLVAADQYGLERLRTMCERRLCETVDVENAATTLTLAEQNHAKELKRVCLEFVARHLGAVMDTSGYKHLTASCPKLQGDILETVANSNAGAGDRNAQSHLHRVHRPREADNAEDVRRVRPRRNDA